MPSIADLNSALPTDLRAIRELAPGGQRQVFLTDWNGTEVILKLMPLVGRPRAEREVAAGFGVAHPHLVEILDSDVQDLSIAGADYCYFRERFIAGDQLRPLVGTFDACQILQLMLHLASAVEHLWSTQRIVHRDIKPENIIRATDGRFVLLDVGIGRHQREPSLTTPLGTPGTPGYYAPEQLIPSRRRTLDFRTDLFLIGVVGYEMSSGGLPFDPTAADYGPRLFAGAPSLVGGSPELNTLLRRLMAPRPHLRYSRFASLTRDVGAAEGALGCT